MIKLTGKKYYPVRGRKLDKIMTNIEKNILFKTTLGGCIIEKVNQVNNHQKRTIIMRQNPKLPLVNFIIILILYL